MGTAKNNYITESQNTLILQFIYLSQTKMATCQIKKN